MSSVGCCRIQGPSHLPTVWPFCRGLSIPSCCVVDAGGRNLRSFQSHGAKLVGRHHSNRASMRTCGTYRTFWVGEGSGARQPGEKYHEEPTERLQTPMSTLSVSFLRSTLAALHTRLGTRTVEVVPLKMFHRNAARKATSDTWMKRHESSEAQSPLVVAAVRHLVCESPRCCRRRLDAETERH